MIGVTGAPTRRVTAGPGLAPAVVNGTADDRLQHSTNGRGFSEARTTALHARCDELTVKIEQMPAKTVEGYRAKAHLMLNIWGGNSFFQIS
jgi:hypothetical protein